MTGSSPARPAQYSNQWASPGQRSTASDFLYENRNSEATHKLVLERARREHERIRKKAEEVYQQYLLKEEQRRVEEERQQEEERIQAEEKLAAERRKLVELRAKKVEIPPVPPPEPPRTAPAQPKSDWPTNRTPTDATPKANAFTNEAGSTTPQTNGSNTPKVEPPAATTLGPSKAPSAATPTISTPGPDAKPSLFGANKPSTFGASPTATSPAAQTPKGNPFSAFKPSPLATGTTGTATPQAAPPAQTNGQTASQVAPNPAPAARAPPPPDRYQQIHQQLKLLRKHMAEQMKTNQLVKSRMGDMRREVRKSMGQLVNGVGQGGNRTQILAIKGILKEALANGPNSTLVNPQDYVVEPRQPVEGAAHNEEALPSLFIYVLNIFAKVAISQFINESSARPETADPVGVVAASVFADREFLWRGKSLIDILLAKFRVVCPVVFGHNGAEKTVEGRREVGFRKDIDTDTHTSRQIGLGAGFAAISLRNFSKSKTMTNPFPPSNYWTAMAKIINTPGDQVSDTQATVLRAMIHGNEGRFLDFYGNAGLAALRLALVELPAKATKQTTSVLMLRNLAEKLDKDLGLKLT